MPIDTQALLTEYKKNRDKNLVIGILEQYGFNPESIKNKDELKLSYCDYKIIITDTSSSYCINFQSGNKSLVTIHLFNGYQIEKEYLINDLKHPISKRTSYILSDSERIVFSEEIKDNIRKRTLKKIFNCNGIDTEIYVKEIANIINKPTICQTVTIENDYNTFHLQKNVDNEFTFKHFSDKKIDEDYIVISEFIEKGNNNQNKNNKAILEANFNEIDIPAIIIRIQKAYFKKNITIINENGSLNVNIVDFIADLKSVKKNTIVSKNTNSLTTEDIDSIIDYFSNLKKKDPVVINELKNIKYALLRNMIYKKGISDKIDIYLNNHSDDSFERLSFDLSCNIEEINNTIEEALTKKSEKIKLELKQQINFLLFFHIRLKDLLFLHLFYNYKFCFSFLYYWAFLLSTK